MKLIQPLVACSRGIESFSTPSYHRCSIYCFRVSMRLNFLVNRFTCIASVIILVPSPAYAYIDPGTGSLIIQGVIGAIAAVGVTLKIYWHKIKVFSAGNSKKNMEDRSQTEDLPQ